MNGTTPSSSGRKFVTESTVERWWPLLCAVGGATVWWLIGKPFPAEPSGLFGTAATVASVFASFLGVSKGLILTMKGSIAYQNLKAAGFIEDLFDYLGAGIRWAIAFAVLSIVGFFIPTPAEGQEPSLWAAGFKLVWVGAGLLAVFCYHRIGSILFKLLRVD